MKVYIDESGNTGDLIQQKIDLTFSNQEIFTLAGISIPDDNFLYLEENLIPKLREEYKINTKELKSTTLFLGCPEFISDLLDYIIEENINFFIEVTDKKYFICNSITRYNIYRSAPNDCEKTGIPQIFREIYTDILFNRLDIKGYEFFFKTCKTRDKKSLLDSFDYLLKFASREIELEHSCYLKIIYELMKNNIKQTKDIYEAIEIKENNALTYFLPLPDKNKKIN